MDRLTAIAKNGMAYLIKVKSNEQEVESPYPNTLKAIMESFNRLAAYEDTALTPEEIMALKSEKQKRDEVCEFCNKSCYVKYAPMLKPLIPAVTREERLMQELAELGVAYMKFKQNYCPVCGKKLEVTND